MRSFLRRRTAKLLLLLALLASYVSCLRGQDTPVAQTAYQLKVNTTIIVLDVVVTDKHGNLVHRTDLTRDDFTVYEDQIPQTILSFETPAQHAMPVTDKAIVYSAADLPRIGEAPVTMLVLDELNSQFMDMSYARQMMVKYLQSQPPILKEPTVLLIAQNTKFLQVHDYTQNRDELISAVKKHMPEIPWKAIQSGGTGPGAVERMAQGLASLQQLAQSARGTPGRKNVIWVGNGFPSADLVSLDDQEATVIENSFRAVTAKLLDSRMTVYTINPMAESSGSIDIETPEDFNDAPSDGTAPMFGEGVVNFADFAPATGGMSFQGRNDLNNVIAEGIAHGEEYYTLSYKPTNKTDDPSKFRRIVVVMKDPELRATTRNGYFPETSADMNPVADKTISTKQRARDLQLDLSEALGTTIAYNGLTVTANKMKDGSLTIHVTGSQFDWSEAAVDGSPQAEATIAEAWFDKKGKMVAHEAREENSARASQTGAARFSLPTLPVPPNAVRGRIVVRDAHTGRMGTFDLMK